MQPNSFGRKASNGLQNAVSDKSAQRAYTTASYIAPRRSQSLVAKIDGLFEFMFNPKGRIPRWQFQVSLPAYGLLGYIVYHMAYLAKLDVHGSLTGAGLGSGSGWALSELGITLLACAIAFWANIVITIKRWHDMDKPAWWALLGQIPVLGWVWQLIMCAAVRGTPGANRYGPQVR